MPPWGYSPGMTAPDSTPPVTIEVATGDIGEIALQGGPWLAVISSDDSMLSHGGGASGSIWKAAGGLEVVSPLPARLGAVVRSTRGALAAEAVLHAVTIDIDRWIGLDSVEYSQLVDRIGDAVEAIRGQVADGRGHSRDRQFRVLLPAIGTGAGGVSTSLAVREGQRLARRLASLNVVLVLATPWTIGQLHMLPGMELDDVELVEWSPPVVERRAGRAGSRGPAHRQPGVHAQGRRLLVSSSDEASQRVFYNARPNPIPQVLSWQSPAVQSPHQHRSPHVDRLVAVLSTLDGVEREDLEDWMEALGYRGESRLRLKELCVRRSPREILERLGAARLRRILKFEFGVEQAGQRSQAELVDRLLRECGFGSLVIPQGLDSAGAELRRLRTALTMAEPAETAGIVMKAAGILERTVRDLLRFICLYLHEAGPERHLKGRAGFDGRPLSKTTLGMLLALLEELAIELEAAEPGSLRELNGPLNAARLVPHGSFGKLEEIAAIRNSFAHSEREAADEHATLKRAMRLYELADELLGFWSEPPAMERVYPTVIRIDRITIDEWNRRLVEATSDAGVTEAIVCDHEVHPGSLYFMLPRTNPFRVDPVLVEFGRADLVIE